MTKIEEMTAKLSRIATDKAKQKEVLRRIKIVAEYGQKAIDSRKSVEGDSELSYFLNHMNREGIEKVMSDKGVTKAENDFWTLYKRIFEV